MSKIRNLPKRIFLQVDPERENPEDYNNCHEVTFSVNRINDNDIEYILKEKSNCKKLKNHEKIRLQTT